MRLQKARAEALEDQLALACRALVILRDGSIHAPRSLARATLHEINQRRSA